MRDLIHPLHITAVALLCSLTTITSCGEAPVQEDPLQHTGRVHTHTKTNAIRPTQGDGHLGNGYGAVEVRSHPSAKGHVRVWWAVTGKDAPPSQDQNNNNVPDFVETVATVGDDVLERLTAKGWKTAISDETLNDGDNGTDARFDIYLRNMTSGDGTFIREQCITSGCAGYITIDNDFSNSTYRSLEEAARVLVSHEYFHAVQSAYTLDVEGWVSEGTATWYEEIFYPEQRDFERLSNLYFENHTRSLNDRVRGPVDSFSYGASIFFFFLSLQYDELLIQEILKELTFEEPQSIAVNRAITARGSSLPEAFQHFSVYNIFTGDRATPQFSYPAAAQYKQVDVKTFGTLSKFNWEVNVDTLASTYGIFDTNEDVVVSLKAKDDKDLPLVALVSARTYPNDGKFIVANPSSTTRLSADDSPYYIVTSSGLQSAAGTIQVRPAPMPTPDMSNDLPDMIDMADMSPTPDMALTPPKNDDSGCASSPSRLPPIPSLLLLGLLGLLTKRRHVLKN